MIKLKNLTRHFGDIIAVDNISFEVNAGEVLGFLGPNGAGKTTTMRMIAGYIEPTEGEIEVNDIDVLKFPEKAKTIIGYLPENAPVYKDMHVYGFLSFVAAVRGFKRKKAKDLIERSISVCHLEPVVYQSIETLSKGFLRRTCFAQAILHNPPVLILDEPTDGLDPNQKFEVRNMIREMGKEKAIIISTHILEEVDACCTRTIIIADGKIVANGTPSELKSRSETAETLVVGIKTEANIEELQKILSALSFVKNCRKIETSNNFCRFRLFPEKVSIGELAINIASFTKEKKWEISEMFTDPGRLDDVFRKITTEN